MTFYPEGSNDLTTEVFGVLRDSGSFCCVECGKCVAVCPMADMYPYFSYDMSPRGFLKAARMSPKIIEDGRLWCCTECNACSETCPEGVSCREMVKGLKKIALDREKADKMKRCSLCGIIFTSVQIIDFLTDKLKHQHLDYLELCPSCRMTVYLRRNA